MLQANSKMDRQIVHKPLRNMIVANEEVFRQGEPAVPLQRVHRFTSVAGACPGHLAFFSLAHLRCAPPGSALGLNSRLPLPVRRHGRPGGAACWPRWTLASAWLPAGRVAVRDYDKIMEEYRSNLYRMRCLASAPLPSVNFQRVVSSVGL
jgi:hypothetical protein